VSVAENVETVSDRVGDRELEADVVAESWGVGVFVVVAVHERVS